jgi:hypothetical protein
MSCYGSTSRSAALILGLVCFLITGHLRAEHEADHRYNVRGYLLDAEERGIANQEVAAFVDGKLLGAGKTDSSGYYSIHLHLHNSDLRQILTLRAGPSQAQLRIKFDPTDKTTVRTHDANFVAGEFVEGDLGHFRLPPWIYPVGGLVVFGFLLVTLEKRRRAKIRSKIIATKSSDGKSKGKKRRHKR